MKLILSLTLLLLTGCAGTKMYVAASEAHGILRVDPPDDSSYDYKFLIKNAHDIGWDGNKEEDRREMIATKLDGACRSFEVIDQKPFKTGTYMFGDDAITWIMKVKCLD
ncbi:hypothetical protein [Methylocaldum szegediense]|uniref:hypothetical protein n=1 Tax=Methylocaldum szegediense TaxID=73780 RepID=UPI0004245893|nr:hypothetical protein [Methylocaldum szegediense]